MKKGKKNILIISSVVLVAVISLLTILYCTNKHSVVFYSDTGDILLIDEVTSFKQATPPIEPEMSYGQIFKSWDTDFSSVKKDLEIHPETESFSGKANVFALPGAYGNVGDYITVPLKLCGEVCLSGFDISVKYDSNILEIESVFDEDGAIVYNTEKPGEIRINYVSLGNTTADIDICSFKFKVKQATNSDLSIEVKSVYANKTEVELYKPETNLINSTVFVLSGKSGDSND